MAKPAKNEYKNQMHSSHNLVCLYWHILDPFIIALTIATRIAIQFIRCLQYKWYSDNHHGLPVSALPQRCAHHRAVHGLKGIDDREPNSLCMAKESAALVGLHMG